MPLSPRGRGLPPGPPRARPASRRRRLGWNWQRRGCGRGRRGRDARRWLEEAGAGRAAAAPAPAAPGSGGSWRARGGTGRWRRCGLALQLCLPGRSRSLLPPVSDGAHGATGHRCCPARAAPVGWGGPGRPPPVPQGSRFRSGPDVRRCGRGGAGRDAERGSETPAGLCVRFAGSLGAGWRLGKSGLCGRKPQNLLGLCPPPAHRRVLPLLAGARVPTDLAGQALCCDFCRGFARTVVKAKDGEVRSLLISESFRHCRLLWETRLREYPLHSCMGPLVPWGNFPH